jgi:hypothetical protein
LAADPTAAAGVGVGSCSEFARKYKEDPDLAETVYFSWAQGFMSGWNYDLLNSKQPIYDLSSQTMQQQQFFIRNYCNQHPLATFSEAVFEIVSLPNSTQALVATMSTGISTAPSHP